VFVRWSSQVIERDDAGRLPGLGDTVVRRFDAPEALDMRFHEVRTKSALNRVPAASRLPFNWTVNPYRGCSHACVYCLAGDTQILLADGHTRALADLRQGDRIYGTRRVGRTRRFVHTEVLAHWSTLKPAYRVTLDDGTELVSSGDHRFLSRHGWRYVAESKGPGPRRTLSVGERLGGLGKLAAAPVEDVDYRRGYLCGAVHGDDHLFRLSPAGREALERVELYLAELGLSMSAAAVAGYREVRVAQPTGESMRHVLAWPWDASPEWCKGFLAGAFDADGSSVDGVRLANSDPAVLRRAADSLRVLGFHSVSEDAGKLRVLGDAGEHLRFFHTVGPAVRRKCTVEGRAVKFPGALRVTSVEPLGFDMPMFDITTGTGDFIANGVVSHNCFARPTHEYLELDAGRDFEREIVVKVNVPEVLRAELRKPSWTGESVALGTNTDPYQWVEGRYKLMRGIWEAFRDYRNPCSVLTKSPLLLRDLDLMKEIAAVTDISACLSVPTLDEKAWRATEPHTPHPRARLEAVAELNRNGIPTGVLMAPLIPGINDAPEQVEKIVEIATEAGATYIGGQTLFLSPAVRRIFMDWLRDYRPDLVPRYERLYAKGSRLSPPERHKIESAAGAPWLEPRTDMDPYRRHRGGARRPPPPSLMPTPVARVKQETLF
jgi:DNA repair photolyase